MRVAALLCVLSSCGSSPSGSGGRGLPGRSDELPVDLVLYEPDGTALDLSRLRGRPVLVWVFATYDLLSTAMVDPLNRLARGRSDQIRIVGLALQPNARELLPIFSDAMGMQFPLAWDPGGDVLAGASPLGQVDAVPMVLVIDERGYLLGVRAGALSFAALSRIVDRAVRGQAP